MLARGLAPLPVLGVLPVLRGSGFGRSFFLCVSAPVSLRRAVRLLAAARAVPGARLSVVWGCGFWVPVPWAACPLGSSRWFGVSVLVSPIPVGLAVSGGVAAPGCVRAWVRFCR